MPNTTDENASSSGTTQDEQLLESPRPEEFTHTDTWRVFRIMGEFVEALTSWLHSRMRFRSSARRSAPSDPDYKAAQENRGTVWPTPVFP